MGNEKTASTLGFPLASILTIIFVLAKIFGKINWSWWWVFSPLWISAILLVIILLAILFVALVAEALD